MQPRITGREAGAGTGSQRVPAGRKEEEQRRGRLAIPREENAADPEGSGDRKRRKDTGRSSTRTTRSLGSRS
eukprot:1184149-Heterocapsa_arctica.AAC.1